MYLILLVEGELEDLIETEKEPLKIDEIEGVFEVKELEVPDTEPLVELIFVVVLFVTKKFEFDFVDVN